MKYGYIQAQPARKMELFLAEHFLSLQHHILLAFNGLQCVRAIAMLRLYYRHEVHLMMAAALPLHFLPLYDAAFLPLLQSKPALKSMLQGAGKPGRACQFYRAINFFAQLPPNAPTFSALCTAPCTEHKNNVTLSIVCHSWKRSILCKQYAS